MMHPLFNGEIAALNLQGIFPTAVKAYPPAHWETFVAACEDHGLLGADRCAFCEGALGWDGILAHAEDCPFEQLDQAMADYHTGGRR